MTKLRFFISILVVLFLLILAVLIAGLSLTLYIDFGSAILGILLPYVIISFIFTPKEQLKFKKEIFKPAGSGDPQEIERALIYFKSFKNILISSAVVWTIMGIIGIMANLEDPYALGPNFAIALIVPFYVSLFLIIVIEPLRAAAEKNLKG